MVTGGKAWIPCHSALGLTFGTQPSDWEEFSAAHKIVSQDMNGDKQEFSSLDETYHVSVCNGKVEAIHFDHGFRIQEMDIIGMVRKEAISFIIGFFGLSDSDVKIDDEWIEIEDGKIQRFIDFDRLCLFLTENGDGSVIGVDVYK